MDLSAQSISWSSDSRGSFAELVRGGFIDGQLSALIILPGQTRGGHYHTYKIETFLLLSGSVEVALRDGPVPSESTHHQALRLDAHTGPQRLTIPPGIHHTFHNFWKEPALFVVHCDHAFDPESPDTFSEF